MVRSSFTDSFLLTLSSHEGLQQSLKGHSGGHYNKVLNCSLHLSRLVLWSIIYIGPCGCFQLSTIEQTAQLLVFWLLSSTNLCTTSLPTPLPPTHLYIWDTCDILEGIQKSLKKNSNSNYSYWLAIGLLYLAIA